MDMNAKKSGAAQSAPSRRSAPTIAPNEEVLVQNGFLGTLTYISKRNGTPLMFNQFGDSDYISFGELQTMRSTQPAFFSNNWILIDDDEILNALGVMKYYENSMKCVEDFYDFFNKPLKQFKAILGKLPSSQKSVLYAIAKEKIANGEIDSLKKIDALEEAFGVSFKED